VDARLCLFAHRRRWIELRHAVDEPSPLTPAPSISRSADLTIVRPLGTRQAANRRKKGNRGGRPVAHDTNLYGDRNTAERAIDKLKTWRCVATCYDKTPDSYLAGVELRAATLWIASLLRPR
jgi:hypothetical protein